MNWRDKAKRIAKRDGKGVEKLMNRYKREADEIINIISTRSAQLELFGYRDLIERIYGVCERLNNIELLYVVVSAYHKFLIGGVLDYVGGIPIWWDIRRHKEDYLNARKELKRLAVPQHFRILQELLLRLYIMKPNLVDVAPVRATVKLIKALPVINRITDYSKDYFRFMRRLNEAAKQNLEEVLELSKRYDEVIKNHIEIKVKILSSMTRLTSKTAFLGLTSLAGPLYTMVSDGFSFTLKEMEKMFASIWYILFLGIFLERIGLEYLNEYIEELIRKGIKYILRKRYLESSDPLSTFYGKGIVWLIWLVND